MSNAKYDKTAQKVMYLVIFKIFNNSSFVFSLNIVFHAFVSEKCILKSWHASYNLESLYE